MSRMPLVEVPEIAAEDAQRPGRTGEAPLRGWVLPLTVGILILVTWDASIRLTGSDLLPTPMAVVRGIGELME
jgi:hypothetical protein